MQALESLKNSPNFFLGNYNGKVFLNHFQSAVITIPKFYCTLFFKKKMDRRINLPIF